MGAAVEIRGVSKRFRFGGEPSLKERVVRHRRGLRRQEFWALHDVDFDVEPGTTVGLLGHNGSGKSTLLKCVAGILRPTEGEIVTTGRVAALLELGAGFHPELTGRENVYLNASVLGLTRREVDLRFDDIVAFAELERFIDQQVRHYSSGMYVRLGFAVAVNMDPEILLVDEVLAVGDEAFQRRCLERVREFQREGRTILFVSHSPDLVRQICARAVVLDHGHLVADGPAGESIRTFREHLLQSADYDTGEEPVDEEVAVAAPGEPATMQSLSNRRVHVTDVTLEHPGVADGRAYLLPHEALSIHVGYDTEAPTDDVMFGVAVHDVSGVHLFGTNTEILGTRLPTLDGPGEVVFAFPDVPLLDGTYLVTLAIQTRDEGTVYDWREQEYAFEVMNPDRTQGAVAIHAAVEHRDAGAPSARPAGAA